jgi:putative heme transporter
VWFGMRVATGVDGPLTSWPEVLTAFSIGYLLTGLPFSPGGLGTLDVAVVAVLTTLGEDPAIASAGLVVYRASTYALYGIAILGWLGWRWRRSGRAASA